MSTSPLDLPVSNIPLTRTPVRRLLVVVDDAKVDCSIPVPVVSLSDLFMKIDEVKQSYAFYLMNELFIQGQLHNMRIIHKDYLLDYMREPDFNEFKIFLNSLNEPTPEYLCSVLDLIPTLPIRNQCMVEIPTSPEQVRTKCNLNL